jgi:hypothetical protein
MAKNPFSNNSIPSVNDEWENEPCKVDILDKDAETRMAIRDNTATEEMIAQMRDKVKKRNKGIAVLIDENKGESAKNLSEAIFSLDSALIDSETIERVKKNINTPKDLSDYAKATETIYNRMMKSITSTADPDEAKKGMKDVKIGLAFGNGKIALAVDTNGDGDNNG